MLNSILTKIKLLSNRIYLALPDHVQSVFQVYT